MNKQLIALIALVGLVAGCRVAAADAELDQCVTKLASALEAVNVPSAVAGTVEAIEATFPYKSGEGWTKVEKQIRRKFGKKFPKDFSCTDYIQEANKMLSSPIDDGSCMKLFNVGENFRASLENPIVGRFIKTMDACIALGDE